MGELNIEMSTSQYEIATVNVGWIKNAYQLLNFHFQIKYTSLNIWAR